jgi:type IV pilus assembly protein PilB
VIETQRARLRDRRLMGEMLVEAGLVGRAGLMAGLEEQRLRGGRLGYNLLKLGVVTPASLYLFLKDSCEVLDPDLVAALRSGPPVDLIPARLAFFYDMVPARVEDGVLSLALADADLPRLVAAVGTLTGMRVDPVVCPPGLIAESLSRFYPAEVEPGVVHRPAGDNVFVVSDRRRGLRPMLPEMLRPDAPAADWLRALVAEAIRRGARSLRLQRTRGPLRAIYRGARGEESSLQAPRGIASGLCRLVEGLAGIGARRRVVPRQGRFLLRVDGRRIAASTRVLPGLEGEIVRLDLRVLRIRPPAAEDLDARVPGLASVLDRLAALRRGLLLLVGPGEGEIGAALDLVLATLGERLPARAALGEWEARLSLAAYCGGADEDVPFEALLGRALQGTPDLLVLPDLTRPECAAAALAQARERLVVAALRAADACEAAAWAGRAAPTWRLPAGDPGAPAGILAVRLLERLCRSCRRACELADILPPRARRLASDGALFVAQGCAACREGGILDLEPVAELLPAPVGGLAAWSAAAAGELRRERAAAGLETLFLSGLRRALAGEVDVREPLRLLLHEQP